jgi:hypothetical protein
MTQIVVPLRVAILKDISERLEGNFHAGINWKNHQYRGASVWLLAWGSEPAVLTRRPGVQNLSELRCTAQIQSRKLEDAG